MKNILVIGGCGYIASHTIFEILKENKNTKITIFDNFETSSTELKNRIENHFDIELPLYEGDIRIQNDLDICFKENNFDSVILFAGYKAAGESVFQIQKYYENNVLGLTNVIESMIKYNVKNIVFSSSAAVYGTPNEIPITENSKTTPENPYGETKLIGEWILRDYCKINKINAIALRYFNVAGAQNEGIIGELNEKPLNLIPIIMDVINEKREKLSVFGNDYKNTKDGTCVRDYIHVCDLAKGHIRALNYLEGINGFEVFNLSTGQGNTVLEVINEIETQSGQKVHFDISEKREGDPEMVFGNSDKANKLLKWKAEFGIKEIIRDALNWEKKQSK